MVRGAPQHPHDRVFGHERAHRPRRRADQDDPRRRGRDHATTMRRSRSPSGSGRSKRCIPGRSTSASTARQVGQNTMHALRRCVASADSFPRRPRTRGYLASNHVQAWTRRPARGRVPLSSADPVQCPARRAQTAYLRLHRGGRVASCRRGLRANSAVSATGQPYVMAVSTSSPPIPAPQHEQHLAAKRCGCGAGWAVGWLSPMRADGLLDTREPTRPADVQVCRRRRPAEVTSTSGRQYADADELIVARNA